MRCELWFTACELSVPVLGSGVRVLDGVGCDVPVPVGTPVLIRWLDTHAPVSWITERDYALEPVDVIGTALVRGVVVQIDTSDEDYLTSDEHSWPKT